MRTRTRAATARLQSHRYRVRHENLHNFEKNLDQNGLLWKKLEHFQIGRPPFLGRKISKISIENFHWKSNWKWKFWVQKISKIVEIEKFSTWFSMNISMFFLVQKFSNFFEIEKNSTGFSMKNFDGKFEIFRFDIFGRPISKCSNFSHNKRFWSRFFPKLCVFSWRTWWNLFPVEQRSAMRSHTLLEPSKFAYLFFNEIFRSVSQLEIWSHILTRKLSNGQWMDFLMFY